MNHPPNDQQWRIIRETTDHLLVSAGAGTGKTTTVVNHILYLIGVPVEGECAAEPIPLRDIAAITYTNAAAADLKRDLRKKLRDAGRRREAYLVDTLRIGTIHAFCGAILREFALHHGGHPDAQVLDDGEANALASEAVRDSMVAAIEEDATQGLKELFEVRSFKDVEDDVGRLVAESDRLAVISGNRADLDQREGAIVDLALLSRRRLDRVLTDRGLIDYDSMIVQTRDLLRHDDVRRALQRRLRVLVIDEFQDVDPVQGQIAYLLGQPGENVEGSTRLLIVGDPKQSIYRFRRADVTVWNRTRVDFERWDGCAVAPLSHNYRSTDSILGFVDHTIGALMDEPLAGDELADYEVRFETLEAGTDDQKRDRSVELIVVPAKSDGKKQSAGDARRIEAEAVARRAAQLVRDGEAEWGDIAILLTGWAALDTYRLALEAAGAPTYPLLNERFWLRREVIDMIVALKAIRDPADDVAFVGFMRSPFVGVKDETLLAAARTRGGRRPYWYARDEVEVGEPELWSEGVRRLERYVELRDRMPTPDLLAELLRETGYLAHLAYQGDHKEQAIGNVHKFLHLAHGMAQLGLGDFIKRIDEARTRKDREADALLSGQDGAVTLTSIHSAKGLEWKVVFVCDLDRGPHIPKDRLIIGRDTIALHIDDEEPEEGGDEAEEPAPDRHAELKAQELAEEQVERKRVWYVAFTRAMERLIVSGLPEWDRDKDNRITPAEILWTRLTSVELEDGAEFSYQSRAGATFAGTVRLANPEDVDERTEHIPDPLASERLATAPAPIAMATGRPRHSATELLSFSRCEKKHWFKYVLGVREPSSGRGKAELVDAISRGLIVHDVLERLREDAELDELLEDAITRHDEDAPPSGSERGIEYREHLREEVQLVSEHADYRALADQPTARHELDFVYLRNRDERYEGSFDLAALDGERITLLDVKTPQCDEAMARKKAGDYAPQRDVYVSAAEGIGTIEVDRFAFQFSRAECQVSEEISQELRQEIGERMAHARERLEADDPQLTASPRECYFCGYQKVGWCPGVQEKGDNP